MTVEDPYKEAIGRAIMMEKEGRAFYLNAAARTSSETGRILFNSLANDELLHLETFKKIFESRVGRAEWQELVDSTRKYAKLGVFPKDLEAVEGARPDTNELDALSIAMEAEKEAIDFYTAILGTTHDPVTLDIIGEIIDQERRHYTILNGEFTHLSSQGHWYGLDILGG